MSELDRFHCQRERKRTRARRAGRALSVAATVDASGRLCLRAAHPSRLAPGIVADQVFNHPLKGHPRLAFQLPPLCISGTHNFWVVTRIFKGALRPARRIISSAWCVFSAGAFDGFDYVGFKERLSLLSFERGQIGPICASTSVHRLHAA